METDEAILAARAKLLSKGGGKGAAAGGMRRKNVKKHVPTVANDKKMQEHCKRMGELILLNCLQLNLVCWRVKNGLSGKMLDNSIKLVIADSFFDPPYF